MSSKRLTQRDRALIKKYNRRLDGEGRVNASWLPRLRRLERLAKREKSK